jgi:hypothetical protein
VDTLHPVPPGLKLFVYVLEDPDPATLIFAGVVKVKFALLLPILEANLEPAPVKLAVTVTVLPYAAVALFLVGVVTPVIVNCEKFTIAPGVVVPAAAPRLLVA